MYPTNFFSLVPPFPRGHRVFVAMSFDTRFDQHWKEVLEPALSAVTVDGINLQPYRVNAGHVSDSILTEILDGISSARLIVADITSIGTLDGRPLRNANVMYEVGLAHAVRLPEEVVLFRSDDDALLFDMANVRVNGYSPETPLEARAVVTGAVQNALSEARSRRHATVMRLTSMLDIPSWVALVESVSHGIPQPPHGTVGQAVGGVQRMGAISRLLALGLLETRFESLGPAGLAAPAETLGRYYATELGKAVVAEGIVRMGVANPAVLASLVRESLGSVDASQ